MPSAKCPVSLVGLPSKRKYSVYLQPVPSATEVCNVLLSVPSASEKYAVFFGQCRPQLKYAVYFGHCLPQLKYALYIGQCRPWLNCAVYFCQCLPFLKKYAVYFWSVPSATEKYSVYHYRKLPYPTTIHITYDAYTLQCAAFPNWILVLFCISRWTLTRKEDKKPELQTSSTGWLQHHRLQENWRRLECDQNWRQ